MRFATTALLMAVCSLTACNGAKSVDDGAAMAGPEPVVILQDMVSTDDALKEFKTHLINSKEELDALGSEVLSATDVDFEANSMIVVALGKRDTAGFWARIDGVQQGAGKVYVQATLNRPDPASNPEAKAESPFAAVIVKKVSGAIVPEFKAVTGK